MKGLAAFILPAKTRTALASVLPTINAQATAPHQFITRTTTTTFVTGGGTRSVDTPQGDYINGGVTLQQSLINVQALPCVSSTSSARVSTRSSPSRGAPRRRGKRRPTPGSP